MSYFVGILVIGVGCLMVLKTGWVLEMTGRIAWAEEHLGTEGGTRMFIKLLGVLLIIGTFLTLTGATGAILGKIFSASMFGK